MSDMRQSRMLNTTADIPENGRSFSRPFPCHTRLWPALRTVSGNRQLGEHRSEQLHEGGAVLRPRLVREDSAQLLPDNLL